MSKSTARAAVFVLALKSGTEMLREGGGGAMSVSEVLSRVTVSASEAGKARTRTTVWMVMMPTVNVVETVVSFLHALGGADERH